MNFLIDLQDVSNGIFVALRTLLLNICEPIYGLIIFCFNIFEDFGKVRLFAESDTISQIYTRIGLILGLFMVFRLTFAGIQYLIDPDKMTDSKVGIGNIVKKVLIVVVLLGSTRSLFNFAYDFQDKLIDSDIVDKLILGPSNTEKEKNHGTDLAWYTFSQFYTINTNVDNTDQNRTTCEKMLDNENQQGVIVNEFYESHKLDNAKYCLNLESEGEYPIKDISGTEAKLNIIDFNGFICVLVGIVLLWIIITYTIQVGIRVFQLAYLELVAPIPIMMYLMPNGDEQLKKWGQQCLTTFLDFFIRIAIMDFIILVSNSLVELTEGNYILSNFENRSSLGDGYITVTLIIALFMFAKRVPDLLKEIFPSMGGAASLSFGIKSPKQAIGDIPYVGGMANKAIGHMGNMGKKAGGFVAKNTVGRAWGATGGRVINRAKANMQASEDARKARYEYKDNRKNSLAAHEKYGADFEAGNYEKVFGDKEYATTYRNLQNAKAEAKAKYGEYTYEYQEAIKSAEKAHEIQKNGKPELAAREKALKDYPSYYPTPKSNSQDNHATTSQTQQAAPSQTQPYISPQQAEENAYNEYMDALTNGNSEEEVRNKQENYETARKKRQENDDFLDEFYDRMDDGFGGQ